MKLFNKALIATALTTSLIIGGAITASADDTLNWVQYEWVGAETKTAPIGDAPGPGWAPTGLTDEDYTFAYLDTAYKVRIKQNVTWYFWDTNTN